MQVIGRFGSDRATLEAALFVESALGPQGVSGQQPQYSLALGCNCLNNALASVRRKKRAFSAPT